MRNLYFIISCLLSLTACQWDLDKFDLEGNIYNCEETCVNGVCDELKNVCVCNDGWGDKNCDNEIFTFEKTIQLSIDTIEHYGECITDFVSFVDIGITSTKDYILAGNRGIANTCDWSLPYLCKISEKGDFLWEKILPDSLDIDKIIILNNNILIKGYSSLAMLSSNAEIIWYKNFYTSHQITISNYKITPQNQFLVVGHFPFANNRPKDVYFFLFDLEGKPIIEKVFAGSSKDYVSSVTYLDDGYLIFGSSNSNDNYFTDNKGDFDLFLLKLDFEGNVLWNRNYGGSREEVSNLLIHTNDNGFLLTAKSKSNNGDVGSNNGESDIWLLKTDLKGEILWERNYGGSLDETIISVLLTSDNGFLLGCKSESNDFDFNINYGRIDVWLVKIESSGNILWKKNYGTEHNDNFIYIRLLEDGSYILQDGYRGRLKKIDVFGTIVLENQYENIHTIKEHLDGGFIMAGSKMDNEIYIIKTDANGEI